MADAQKYAKWIVDNQDKKGTPEFETVANAYQAAKAGVKAPQQFLVAGTPEQQNQARAANLQSQMGLEEPVAVGQSVGMGDRLISGFAPTPQEKQAYYEAEYGKGSFVPISTDRALVRVPDGKGGKHWVVDNPVGLDVGDIAQFQSNLPQFVAGAGAAIAAVPTVASAPAKLAMAAGAGAAASGIVGGIQDIIFRASQGLPIKPGEIVQRRGLESAIEAGAGFGLSVVGGKVASGLRAGKAVRDYWAKFSKEGDEAAKVLRLQGINPSTAGELADAIRNTSPARASAADMGDALAAVVNEQDRLIRKGADRLAGKAISDVEARAQAAIGNATQAAPVTPPQAGLAAIGAAKKQLLDANKQATDLLTSALDDIQKAGLDAGKGKNIIQLSNTERAVIEIKENLPKYQKITPDEGAISMFDAFGKKLPVPDVKTTETIDIFTPLLSMLNGIKKATTVSQELVAARNMRSMLGAKIGGQSDLFPGLDVGFAKNIYKALSQDIDESVSRLSGPGAQKLRDYNRLYKSIVQPIEENEFLGKLVNDGFNNPEDVVRSLANGGSADWAAAKSVLSPNVYAQVRRSVADELMGGERLTVFGKEVANIPALSKRLSSMAPEVKDEIFGSKAAWQSLQKIGKEYDYLIERGSMFTKPSLPSMAEVEEAVSVAKSQGLDKANAFLSRAIKAAAARRNGMAESLLSHARSGNFQHITKNPEDFLNSVVFNDGLRPEYVRSIMKKLPADTREEMGAVAFQQIFENARDAAKSTLSRRQSVYNVDEVVRSVFGTRKREEVIGDIIGPERINLLRNWAKYEVKLAAESRKKEMGGKRIAGLIATAPYQNLFAARAASLALERAAGSRYIAGATPGSSELFAETRRIITQPSKTASQVVALQRALNTDGWQDYQEMMQGFTPEQQDAIDSYLTGQ